MKLTGSTRVALVAEELSDRPDEGVLRALERLCLHLHQRTRLLALHTRGRAPDGIEARKLRFTRLGTSAQLRGALRQFRPELVVYAPSASLTANAMWRARTLRSVTAAPVVLVGLQRREHGLLARAAMRSLRCDALVVTTETVAAPFRARGWNVILARLGVDLDRFHPLEPHARERARHGLGWNDGRRVILHVGHLRRRRGLEELCALARAGRHRVVMVASISETGEEELAASVVAAGVELHHEFIPDIERYYQAADAYLFPVRHRMSAIDFPLSVFEALACGTPVLSTPYGALPEHFDGTGGLRFLAPGEAIDEALEDLLARRADPRSLAVPFGWPAVLDALVDDLQEHLP